MIKKQILFTLILYFVSNWAIQAQVTSPTGKILEENGKTPDEETILAAGDSYTASAPLKMLFEANATEQDGYTYNYEWVIFPADNPSSPILRRFEPATEYVFYDSGTFGIQLRVSYTTDGLAEPLEEEYDPITIVISESSLKVPNAFSPNGDGINDVFRVTYKSLIEFKANIFNRWGQRIYSWNLSNIDEGWDGTKGGTPVKDGVYFIVVQARGSDGIEYEIKQDINILRGQGGLNGGGGGGGF